MFQKQTRISGTTEKNACGNGPWINNRKDPLQEKQVSAATGRELQRKKRYTYKMMNILLINFILLAKLIILLCFMYLKRALTYFTRAVICE